MYFDENFIDCIDSFDLYYHFLFIFLVFSFIIVMGEGTLWHLHRFLQCLYYHFNKISSSNPEHELSFHFTEFNVISFINVL
jgi:hypothetical protein